MMKSTISTFALALLGSSVAAADSFTISHDTCDLLVEREQFSHDDELHQMLYSKGYRLHIYDYDLLARYSDRNYQEAVRHFRSLPKYALIINTSMDVDRRYIFGGWRKKQFYTYKILQIDGKLNNVHIRAKENPNGSFYGYIGENSHVVAKARTEFDSSLFDFGTNWDGFEMRAGSTIEKLPDCRADGVSSPPPIQDYDDGIGDGHDTHDDGFDTRNDYDNDRGEDYHRPAQPGNGGGNSQPVEPDLTEDQRRDQLIRDMLNRPVPGEEPVNEPAEEPANDQPADEGSSNDEPISEEPPAEQPVDDQPVEGSQDAGQAEEQPVEEESIDEEQIEEPAEESIEEEIEEDIEPQDNDAVFDLEN